MRINRNSRKLRHYVRNGDTDGRVKVYNKLLRLCLGSGMYGQFDAESMANNIFSELERVSVTERYEEITRRAVIRGIRESRGGPWQRLARGVLNFGISLILNALVLIAVLYFLMLSK